MKRIPRFILLCRVAAAVVWLLLTAAALLPQRATAAAPSDYFRITVVDDATGRGVPLVELRTVNEIRFVTDSNGIAAVGDPDLIGQTVYFRVSSPGYEYPKDGFGYRGTALKLISGGQTTIKIHRTNVAERLYRLTGSGIYRDSVLVGERTPLSQPLMDGLVMGQDTVEVTPYRGRLYWFFGDTERPAYPLGQFATSGATSLLPGKGGLDPSVGVDLTYWVDGDGFSKKMIPLPDSPGPIWVGGLFTLNDGGQEHLYTHYAQIDRGGGIAGSGLAVFDDVKAVFTPIHAYELHDPLVPEGHPFLASVNGKRYIYFEMTAMGAFPLVRTIADLAHVEDSAQYEGFTCLAPGARFDGDNSRLERDTNGRLVWAWKANTAPLGEDQVQKLVKAGKMKGEEALLQLRDVETDKTVLSHGGSVFYNPFRKRWIQITTEVYGSPSFLGEMWFSEADTPVGPWTYARHIVTHDHYTFYNPTQHPFFDQHDGRTIYFEGTYTDTYSDIKDLTPRYNYNQLMYRLSLDDPRLSLPVPVYRLTGTGAPAYSLRDGALQRPGQIIAVPFFAIPPESPHDGLMAVYLTEEGGFSLQPPTAATMRPLFYALPALPGPGENASPALIPLYAASGVDKPDSAHTGGKTVPLCRVWRNPSTVARFDWSARPE